MEEVVIVQKKDCAGIILLNRPKSLNSLTLEMIRIITKALLDFKNDPAVTRVIIKGAGERAFCSGADVRLLSELAQKGSKEEVYTFFREEYALNNMISQYPKPYIALLNGITMGGGVGLSHHGRYRVASESYVFSMPEVTIGLFPDVGASYILAKLEKNMGFYLGMTGDLLTLSQAYRLGLVTHHVPYSSFFSLEEALCKRAPVEDTLGLYSVSPQDIENDNFSYLMNFTEQYFRINHAWDIIPILKQTENDTEISQKILKIIDTKSPLSVAIAFELIKRARNYSLEEVLRLDLKLVKKIALSHDFREGVRAQLIDKDKKPQWDPPKLDSTLLPYLKPLFDS